MIERRGLLISLTGLVSGLFRPAVAKPDETIKLAAGQVWVDKLPQYSFGFVYVLLHDYFGGWHAAQWHAGRDGTHEWLYFYKVVRVSPNRDWRHGMDFAHGLEMVRTLGL